MLIDEDLPVAIPAGAEPWIARALSTGPDDGRVDIAGIETADGLTIETHRKMGWRYRPGGHVMAQDLNLEDTARQAVSHVLHIEADTPLQDDTRPPGDRYLEETMRLGSLVHDPTVWPTRPLSIDGTSFALFVTTTAAGQAAVADLGPVRLALYGPAVPDDLTLKLAHLSSIAFDDYPHP